MSAKPYESVKDLPWAYAKNPQTVATLAERDALRAERDTWQQRAVDGAQAALKATIELAATKGREERFRAALNDIRTGKTEADNRHPLGVDRSMAIRFISVANAALAEKPEGVTT